MDTRVDVAAVINDDVRTSDLIHDFSQQFFIGLVSLIDANAFFRVWAFVVIVESHNFALGEISPPHAQGAPAMLRIVVAANADLQQRYRTLAEMMKIGRIVGRIPVAAPFVGA